MKFKIDENLPIDVCNLLRRAGHDAVSVIDQQMSGSPDSDVAAVCKHEQRALITLDTDFSNILAYPPEEFPGIVVIRSRDQSKPTVLAFISQIITAMVDETLECHLWIVEDKGIRIRSASQT